MRWPLDIHEGYTIHMYNRASGGQKLSFLHCDCGIMHDVYAKFS